MAILNNLIYIKKNHYAVKWDEVSKIKEFDILSKTEQNPLWHSEIWVHHHTKMVVENAIKLFNDTSKLSYVMIVSALFHDIGKGACTYFNEEKGTWSSPNHAEIGAKITEELLKDEDEDLIEIICWFVRNHMKPLELYDSKRPIKDLLKLSNTSPNVRFCTIENLFNLKQCDCNGSKMKVYDGWKEKLDFLKNVAIKYKCYNKPYDL